MTTPSGMATAAGEDAKNPALKGQENGTEQVTRYHEPGEGGKDLGRWGKPRGGQGAKMNRHLEEHRDEDDACHPEDPGARPSPQRELALPLRGHAR